MAQREAERDDEVDRQLPRLLSERASRRNDLTDVAHVILAGLVGALLWDALPPAALLGWTGAVVSAVVAHALARAYIRAPGWSVEGTPNVVRWTALAMGLAWGLGAARAAPVVPVESLALLVAVLVGLLAITTVTLLADAVAFALFSGALVLPFWFGLAGSGGSRFHVVALMLIPVLVGTLALLFRRSHRALVGHLGELVRLELGEAEASRERRFLDSLLMGAPIAIAALDRDGRVMGVNGAFERLFGYSAEQMAGGDLDRLIVPEEGRKEALRLTQELRASGRASADVERRDSEGTLIPVRVSASAVSDGSDDAFFVLYHDLSAVRSAERALREAEDHYRELVESASDLVWQVDRRKRWTFLNAACAGMYGAEPKELLGQPMAERVDPEWLDRHRDALRELFEGGELMDFEALHRDVQGNPKHVSIAARPVRDSSGTVVGARGIARDVTERAQARQALEEAREIAERTAEAKTAFLANVSHEIRTPMNGVLGMMELLLDSELSPDQRRTAELVRSSADTLLELINDLLDFSKIEAERVELEDVSFDLPALVESTARMLGVRASRRRLEMITDIGSDVPRRVRGDPGRMRQVLANLIGNAVKFTEEGEVIVSLSTGERRDDVAVVRFAIRDTGIGIPADHLRNIFQDFTQADTSHTRKYGGTGLGLAISRRLVELMGGRIEVESEVGRGSEFTFELPLTVEAVAEPGPPLPARLRGARVLVVDDHPTSRRVVSDMLSKAGPAVEQAGDAAEALEAMYREQRAGTPYDLVVIDAFMPETDGFELARTIRAQPALAETRLMMLTFAGQRGDAQRCRELGITGYLVKPVAGAELVEAAGAVLEGPGEEIGGLVTRHTIEEHRQRLRILLAEDNRVNQKVATAMLRKRGHDVDIVGDGRKAVEAVRNATYDVVLMDIQMPELDGLEATREIRALPGGQDLPIVACTAHAMEGEEDRCLAAGMSGYLTKPFKPYELYAAVEGWIEAPAGPAAPGDEGAAGEAVAHEAVGVDEFATDEAVAVDEFATDEAVAVAEAARDGGVEADGTVDAPAGAAAGATEAPPLDLEEFRSTMREAGVEEVVEEMLEIFAADAPLRLEALMEAVEAGDARAIEQAAHAFKSAAGAVTARALAAELKAIELAAAAGDVERARSLSEGVRGTARVVFDYLGDLESRRPVTG